MIRANGNGLATNYESKPVGGNRCGAEGYVASIVIPPAELDASRIGLERDPESVGKADQARQIVADAVDKAHELKSNIIQHVSDAGQSITESAESAKAAVVATTKNLNRSVQDADYHAMVMSGRTAMRHNPARTLMIAAGLGLVAGLLMRRR